MRNAGKRPRSPRGALTILAMFALGGAVLWGLFHAQRATSPPSPELPWGAPKKAVRFVSIDCRGLGADALRPTLDAIRAQDPDFVMLQQVPAADVLAFVERLSLQQSYSTPLFQRTGMRGGDETGCMVLSKHPLYEARGVLPDGRRGVCLGTWAVAAVGGVRFAVLSTAATGASGVDAAARAWREAGAPAVVVGLSTPRGPGAKAAEWDSVVSDGSVLADTRWFVTVASGPSPAGFAVVELSGSPPPVTLGVPSRALRFASYNVYHDYRGIAGTTAEVLKLDPPPDFLFLEEIEPQNVRPWGDTIKPLSTYYPPLGWGSDGAMLWPDTAILSRHRLTDGKPLQTADGHTFGLLSMAVVDNKKFAVAAVHLWPTWGIDPRHVAFTARKRNEQLNALIQTWQQAGSPPLVLGGDFNQIPIGGNYELMTRHFTDTLKVLSRDTGTFPLKLIETRIDYHLATPQWQPRAGGVLKGNASDHYLIWVDLGRAAASQPTSGAATAPATLPR